MADLVDRFVKVFEEFISGLDRHIISGILLNFVEVSYQIYFFGAEPLRTLDKFPAHEKHREHSNHSIREEKGWNTPFAGKEDCISADKGHDEASGKCIPCDIRLTPAFVR